MEDVELFNKILKAAVDSDASDVHIKIDGPVMFRIHGDLVAVEAPVPTEAWVNKVTDAIVPAHAKKRFIETREADFSYYVPGIGRFRTNVFQQRGQFCISMRYVKTNVPAFEELGLLEVIRDIARSPRGIVLVCGATGSGKSTTLAAMIEYINANFKRHIITLEDPIEFVFEDNQSVIEQREVGLDTLSFQEGLRHILRQDPDIIMVGEMRDTVSLSAAISSADTGHLVFSTLHTTNAPQSVTRILDFFPAEDRDQVRRQLASTLQAVICQRLVPTIDGKATPAIEVMINTPTVRKLIEDSRFEKLAAAIETGTDDGMINFNQHLFALVQEGKITKEAALEEASNPQALEMNFKGIFLDEGRRILS